jgi:hypothetical protein
MSRTDSGECPRCGKVTGCDPWYDRRELPCATIEDCLRHVKERLDKIERVLDEHRLG